MFVNKLQPSKIHFSKSTTLVTPISVALQHLEMIILTNWLNKADTRVSLNTSKRLSSG
jgi:hypothetical protein